MAWLRCRAAPLRDRGGDSPGEPDSLNHDLLRARSLWGVKSLRPPPTTTGSWHANTRPLKLPKISWLTSAHLALTSRTPWSSPSNFRAEEDYVPTVHSGPQDPSHPSPKDAVSAETYRPSAAWGSISRGSTARTESGTGRLLPAGSVT